MTQVAVFLLTHWNFEIDPETAGLFFFFFQNVILLHDVVRNKYNIYVGKLVQCNRYLISTMATDALVLKHRGISWHCADYAPMRFQVFWGYNKIFNYIF